MQTVLRDYYIEIQGLSWDDRNKIPRVKKNSSIEEIQEALKIIMVVKRENEKLKIIKNYYIMTVYYWETYFETNNISLDLKNFTANECVFIKNMNMINLNIRWDKFIDLVKAISMKATKNVLFLGGFFAFYERFIETREHTLQEKLIFFMEFLMMSDKLSKAIINISLTKDEFDVD